MDPEAVEEGEACAECGVFYHAHRGKIILQSCKHGKCLLCYIENGGNCSQCAQAPASPTEENMDPRTTKSAAESTGSGTSLTDEEWAARFPVKKCRVVLHRLSPTEIRNSLPSAAGPSSSATSSTASPVNTNDKIPSVRGPSKSFECSRCNLKFPVKRLFEKHILTHPEERPYLCDQCGRTFTQNAGLARHATTHSRGKPSVGRVVNLLNCTDCTALFTTKFLLELHKSKAHKIEAKSTENKSGTEEDTENGYESDSSVRSLAPPELSVEAPLTYSEDNDDVIMPTLDPQVAQIPALAAPPAPVIVPECPQVEEEPLPVTSHVDEAVPMETTTSQQAGTEINEIAESDRHIPSKPLVESPQAPEPKENDNVSEMGEANSDLTVTDNQYSPPSPDEPEVVKVVLPSTSGVGVSSEVSPLASFRPTVIKSTYTSQSDMQIPEDMPSSPESDISEGILWYPEVEILAVIPLTQKLENPEVISSSSEVEDSETISVDENGSVGDGTLSEQQQDCNNMNENLEQVPLEKGDEEVDESPPAKRPLLSLDAPLPTSPDESMKRFEHLLEDKDDWKRSNQNGETILHTATRLGNLEALHYFLSLGADANAKTKLGETPLHYIRFCKENVPELIKILLVGGADINARDFNGNTALLKLAEYGTSAIKLSMLVEYGCNWKITRNNGESILHVLAQDGNFDALDHFIFLGANVNAQDNNLNTPLHSAAQAKKNFMECFKILVANGADLSVVNNTGNTVLYVTVGNQRSSGDMDQFFQQILTICPSLLNQRNVYGFSAMHTAAETGNIPALKCLISHGADIHSRCNQQRTPLHHAMYLKQNFQETVDLLLEHEADINAVDSQGNNIVFFAAFHCRAKQDLDYLISRGGNWLARNKLGNSILHLAANSGFPETVGYFISKGLNSNFLSTVQQTTPLHQVPFTKGNFAGTLKILVEKQAEVNAVDKDGNNVFFLAILTGRSVEELELLVNYGCDWKARNKNGQSILHLAAQSASLEVLKYLITKGADLHSRSNDGRTPFHQLIFTKNMFAEKLKLFLEAGADIRAVDKDRMNVLQMAVYFGKDRNFLEALVRGGACWKAVRSDGYGVLHLAAERGHLEAVKYFISLRANVNASSNPGDTTPLHRVVYTRQHFQEILTLLHKRGANINAVDDQGNSVIFMAARAGRLGVELEEILKLGGDWTVINKQGESILHAAALAGNVQALQLFMGKGANVNLRSLSGKMPLHCAVTAQRNFPMVVELLIGGGVDINAVDNQGNNLLMLTALKGRSKTDVEYILSLGGDWTARNVNGQSILDLAVEGKNLEVVAYLLTHADWKPETNTVN